MSRTPITAGMSASAFISALNNNYGGRKIVISDQAGADYASLNTAVAAIDTIKTFSVESAITLTASIVFPAGCILIIAPEGSISGAFTLTGNSTSLIIEGTDSCIGTTVTFAGTWLCKNVTPEQFGAKGDAVLNTDSTVTGTDDQTALTKMFAFVALTREKKITFGSKKTYYSTGAAFSIGSMSIDGNHSTLLKDDSSIMGGGGSIGTYYNLTANAYKNDSWIHCTDATLLASLSPGDCIKIISTEICQPASGEDSYMGEMHLVRSIDTVNGIIYLNENLHWYYLLSDTAQVARAALASYHISNLRFWSIGESVSAVALSFSYANVELINIFCKAFYYGVLIMDSYKPKVSMTAMQQDKDGVGYGITVGGATMYADITFLNVGCRHSFTTSGNYHNAGIVWGARVHDSIAVPSVIVAAGPFDTHASSGSVYFDNCIVFGGIPISYVNSITDWDSGTTYTGGELVRSLTEYALFYADAGSTNKDPDDVANYATWGATNLCTCTAFKSEGLYEYYNNCKAYNVAQGFYAYGVDMKRVSIRNCEVYNSLNGIYSAGTATVEELEIDGFKHYNDDYMHNSGYGMLLACNYTRGRFNNFHVRNVIMIDIITPVANTKFELTNFSSICDVHATVLLFNHQAVKQCILTNGRLEGTGPLFYSVNDNGHAATELLMINNVTCEDSYGSEGLIHCGHPVVNVILNGVVSSNTPSDLYFFAAYRNVTNLSISNCAYFGTNATKIIYTDAAYTLSKLLHNNNLFPNLVTFKTGTGAVAAVEIISGSLGAERMLRGVGAPENVVSAPVGCIYQRSDGAEHTVTYIKVTGTGNTGWVANEE